MNTIVPRLMREKIRKLLPENAEFIFEILREGYCRVQVSYGFLPSEVTFYSGGNPNYVDEIGERVVDDINRMQQSAAQGAELADRTWQTITEAIKNPSYEYVKINTPNLPRLQCFKAIFDAGFSDEENESARDEIRMTVANRQWLRDEGLGFDTTEQANMFHEEANIARVLRGEVSCEELFEIYEKVMKRV
jgi:hypothetical protein